MTPEIENKNAIVSTQHLADGCTLNGDFYGPNEIAMPNQPLANAGFYYQTLLADNYPTLLCINENYFRWNGLCYEELNKKSVEARIAAWLAGRTHATQLGQTPFPTTQNAVTEILTRLHDHITIDPRVLRRGWIWHQPTQQQLANYRDAIATPLGWFVPSAPTPLPPDRNFFNLRCCPISPDFNAACPVFDAACAEWFLQDPKVIMPIEEFYGYTMTNNTSFEKTLYLYGASRAGKSLIIDLLAQLVQNFLKPTVMDLLGPHGTQGFTTTDMLIFEEFRPTPKDAPYFLTQFLNFSSFKPVTENPKGKPQFTAPFKAKCLFSANAMANFPNDGRAFANRILPIEFKNSKDGVEDPTLFGRILPELPAILCRAIAGYARLLKNKKFTMTEEMMEISADLKKNSTPVGQFIEDCILHDDDPAIDHMHPVEMRKIDHDSRLTFFKYAIPSRRLHDEFRGFCRSRGIVRDPSLDVFTKELLNEMRRIGKRIERAQPRIEGVKTRMLLHIKIKPWDGQTEQNKDELQIGHSLGENTEQFGTPAE
jgi:putative DNA primase/helicase